MIKVAEKPIFGQKKPPQCAACGYAFNAKYARAVQNAAGEWVCKSEAVCKIRATFRDNITRKSEV